MPTASLVARNVTPVWTHDCAECRFLGALDGEDLYVCDIAGSLVRRFGDAPSENGSMALDMARHMHGNAYAFARILAAKRWRQRDAYHAHGYAT